MFYNQRIMRPKKAFALGGIIQRPVFTTMPVRPINKIIPFIQEQTKPIIRNFQK